MFKALHVASFTGNIGDNANHQGSRRVLSENLGEVKWTQLEMRESYWGRWSFNQEFVDMANQFDFVMIGGGGYFELWVDKSVTGTTIDLAPDLLAKIKKPLIFYGLGCDIGKGAPQHNVDKFQQFLDVAFSLKNCLISVRNDGSLANIEWLLGDRYSKHICKIPDGGFFIQPDHYMHPEIVNGNYIIINLAGDMMLQRFPKRDLNNIDYEDFKVEMVKIIEAIVENLKLAIVFTPHIYKDLSIIADILELLPDWIRRQWVTVTPYLTGFKGQDYIFDVYRNAQLVLGNRFHANVCSIGLARPSIGLSNYPKVQAVYNELNMSTRCIEINKQGFGELLLPLIQASINNETEISSSYKSTVHELRLDLDAFHKKIHTLIHS